MDVIILKFTKYIYIYVEIQIYNGIKIMLMVFLKGKEKEEYVGGFAVLCMSTSEMRH